MSREQRDQLAKEILMENIRQLGDKAVPEIIVDWSVLTANLFFDKLLEVNNNREIE